MCKCIDDLIPVSYVGVNQSGFELIFSKNYKNTISGAAGIQLSIGFHMNYSKSCQAPTAVPM